MSKEKEKERAVGKSSGDVEEVFLYVRGPLRDWLHKKRGGDKGKQSGRKLQPIILDALQKQMERETKD